MGNAVDHIKNLELLLLFRDIGITAIPDYASDENINITLEKESMRKNHCEIGYRIANSISDISIIAQDILAHHENWDGSGYPQGLRGESIPLNSRIISVLDAYELMINRDESLSKDGILEFIKNNSGIYFDPKIVEVFLNILK